MTKVPPPQGLNEADYEAIEAAVTETVRGRWFLTEFARRNRITETRQMLDAIARLEASMTSTQLAIPTADPSIRLMIQRIKEIAAQLGAVASDMREAGIDDRFVSAVDLQARAVAGMMRGNASPRLPGSERMPTLGRGTDMPPPQIDEGPTPPRPMEAPPPIAADDPRLAVLSGFQEMSLTEKLTLFS